MARVGRDDGQRGPRDSPPTRPPWDTLAARHGVGVLAAIAAVVLRRALDPVLGDQLSFALLYPAIVAVAVIAGQGPALVATAIGGALAAWLWLPHRGAALGARGAAYLAIYAGVSLGLIRLAVAQRRARQEADESRAAARASEERVRDVIDGLFAFVGLLTPDGVLIEANRAALEAIGARREDVLGRPFPETPWWDDPGDVARLQDAIARCARGEVLRFDVRHPLKDGRVATMDFMLTPVRDADGRVRYLVPSSTDVTERRRAEEALREADARKDEFLAVLGHELRNPLGPIRNSAALLRLRADDAPAVRREADRIERQVGHITRLIDDLLDVSRVARGLLRLQRRRLDLRAVVREVCDDQRPAYEARGLRLEVRVPAHALPVQGDPVRLAQVLENVLVNSAKFTDPGGVVTVRADVGETGDEPAPEAADGPTDGGGAAARRAAILEVTDTGIGMDAATLARSFEPFAQGERSVERSRGGLGIGLALVRSLTRQHGGSVQAASDGPGRGTTITVRLPLAAELAPSGAPHGARPEGAAAARARRVLLVEDNPDAAESLAMLVTAFGHEVVVAATGREALDRAAAFRPDVVLCDVGLPGMSGYEVARALRGRDAGRASLLVALTGFGGDSDKRRAREAGFDLHLTKPVAPAELERLLGGPPGEPAGAPAP